MTIFRKDPAKDIYPFRHYDDLFLQIFGMMLQADMISSAFVVDNEVFRSMYDINRVRRFLAQTCNEVIYAYGQTLGFSTPICASSKSDFHNLWCAVINEWEKRSKMIKDDSLLNVLII